MEIKREIKCYTPGLYNIVCGEGNERCNGYSCEEGKCICMDKEQEGLLRKLVSRQDLLIMNINGDRICFVNLASSFVEEWICSYETKGECSKNFFDFTKSINDAELQKFLENRSGGNIEYDDILKVIPVIYMINFSNKIEDRNPIINLCVFSDCQDFYLTEVFKSVICRTIACCKKAEKQEQKDAYVHTLALMIKRLNDTFNKQISEKDKVVCAIDSYSQAWRKSKSKIKWGTRAISHMLETYRKDVEEKIENTREISEEYKYDKLYSISKKILETSGVSTDILPSLSFVNIERINNEYQYTEYDEILGILDAVKSDKDKLVNVWDAINKIFLYDAEVSTEDIEELQQIKG